MVKLASLVAHPKQATDAARTPLVILHGLFGSKQNWRSLSKQLAQQCARTVHALDLRNHGDSAWLPDASVSAMAADVDEYLDDNTRDGCTLVGHSLGGKVAMRVALQSPLKVRSVISVDMPPRHLHLSSKFREYLQCMQSIQVHSPPLTKAQADTLLTTVEPDKTVRQFLLTNYVPYGQLHPQAQQAIGPRPHDQLVFRINLAALAAGLDAMAAFDAESSAARNVNALLLHGSKSGYVRAREDSAAMSRLFANARLQALDAGHWLHSERPREFVAAVKAYLQDKP